MKPSSALFLLLPLLLAGCGNSSSAKTSSEEEPVSSAPIANISILANDVSSDVAIGSKVPLTYFVTVKGTDVYRAEALSDNVVIDGHDLIALDYGPFSFRVIAGNRNRIVKGAIVSKDKVEFNELFELMRDNFTAFWTIGSGENLQMGNYVVRAPGYVATYHSYDLETLDYRFDGTIVDPEDGHPYLFEIHGDVAPSGDRYAMKKQIKLKPGYGPSLERQGFDPISLSPDDIEELYTEGGYPQKLFYYDDEQGIETFCDNLLGGGWYYLSQTLHAKALLFTPISSGIRVVPVSAEGTAIDSEIDIMAIGESELSACQSWLEEPTRPDPIDVNPIQTIFQRAIETKSYNIQSYGQWMTIGSDGSTAGVDCPEQYKFIDTHTDFLPNFRCVGAFDGDMAYSRIVDVATTASNFADLDNPKKPGETEVYFNKDGSIYHSLGTYDVSQDAYAMEEPFIEPASSHGTDIWGLFLSPALFGKDEDILSKGSFYDTLVDGTKTYYYLNPYGPDREMYPSCYGLIGAAHLLVGNDMGQNALAMPSSYDWFDYATLLFHVDEQAEELSFMSTIAVGGNYYYRFSWTIKGIGTTHLPEKLIEAVNP